MRSTLEISKNQFRLRASRIGQVLMVATLPGLGAHGLAAQASTGQLRIQASSASAVQAATPVLVREIDDEATGGRWLLESDPANPGGPGRLVLIQGRRTMPGKTEREANSPARSAKAAIPFPIPSLMKVIIRAGDRLVVEQKTSVIEARLEAVAMSPAGQGVTFQARLTISGKVVRAVALAPGRASLAPEIGGWR